MSLMRKKATKSNRLTANRYIFVKVNYKGKFYKHNLFMTRK